LCKKVCSMNAAFVLRFIICSREVGRRMLIGHWHGNGAVNMVTDQYGFDTSDLSITVSSCLDTLLAPSSLAFTQRVGECALTAYYRRVAFASADLKRDYQQWFVICLRCQVR
jgi:hypothetical protein